MRGGGRVFGGLLPPLACIYALISITVCREHGVPVEIKIWDTGRTPLAQMVDVTNGFGLKVLAEHNFLNDNNIAFSPYGLMGIMVALYEGVDGESSYQIQRGMQLPWNRNVMRVGFRDIHRTLKTYFVPEEGFLAGLALNNENVTFNDGYKKILRFYGFDLENEQLPTLPPANSSNDNPVTTTMIPVAGSETTPMTTIAMSTEGTNATPASTKEETTANPNAETVNIDIRAPTEATTMSPSSAPNAESTTVMTTALATETTSLPPIESTTSAPLESTTISAPPESTTISAPPESTTIQLTTISVPSDSTTIQSTTISAPSDSTTIQSTTSAQPESTTILISTASSTNMPVTPEPDTTIAIVIAPNPEADAESIAQQTSQATSALTEEPTPNSEVFSSTVDMGQMTADPTSEISTATTSEMTESVMTTMSEVTTEQGSTVDAMTTDSSMTATESSLETLQRRKKSIVDFIFTNPPYVDDYFFYRSYNVGPEYPGPGIDDQMFLANGLKSIQVSYMRYDAVLEHAFLPHLEASALRLPLDSDRYYLLVVLPNRGGPPELGRLLGRMARESDLADVYAALRPRRVRATVPSFIVKGHVTLTTDLQKVGIRDVFEPRQRDFTLMTRQSGVYVRSIEQAVSVAIRKYQPDDHKKNRYVHNRDPVTFHATYPFLYFVMDASIHVALMAGKMVDPLNSRIL